MGILAGGVNLYFIYKFLRILTTKWEDTDAFKLGIIDEKGKILKKHSTLKSSDEKDAYTLMHRLVWKLKRLLNKIPGGKSKLASYAAALWLIKEEREFTGTNEELQESFLTFLESDWKNDALILKETYEGDMNKTTYTTLMSNMSEAGDKEAYQAFFKATLKKFGVTEPDQLEGDKKKKFFDAIDKGWKGDNEKPEPGDKKEEVEIDEAVLVNRDYKYDGKVIKISKKNFRKVSKDYKNDTAGKERMITYDSKWGTVSVPVEFTEGVEITEIFSEILLEKKITLDYSKPGSNPNSPAARMKKAFDDAGIKMKPKAGKIVVAKKDKEKASGILGKLMYNANITALNQKDKKIIDAALDKFFIFEEVEMEEAVNLKKLKKEYEKNEDDNYHRENYLLLAKAFGTKSEIKKVEEIMKRSEANNSTSQKDNDWMYKNIMPYYNKIRNEEVKMDEAKGTAYPATIDTLKMIVREKQNQTVMFKSGKAIVDLFTASAMVQVYDALKKPEMKKTFEKMIGDKAGFLKTQAFAMKMISGGK